MPATCHAGANEFIETWFHDCVYKYVVNRAFAMPIILDVGCVFRVAKPSSLPRRSARDMVGFLLGMASIGFWMVAQIPQLVANYRTKRADALSAWFLAEWLLVGWLTMTALMFDVPYALSTNHTRIP